jgi:mannose-6-phosphate isomerase-like protein (cupin superfamily)
MLRFKRSAYAAVAVLDRSDGGLHDVKLTRLAPNAASALRHAHTRQDEFIYVLQGRPTLHTDEGRTRLFPGMCAGFKAGTGNGHRLLNETSEEVVYRMRSRRNPERRADPAVNRGLRKSAQLLGQRNSARRLSNSAPRLSSSAPRLSSGATKEFCCQLVESWLS